jgi:separase
MSPRVSGSAGRLCELGERLDTIFHSGLNIPEKRPRPRSKGHSRQPSRTTANVTNQIDFDDSLLECIAALSPKCRDEELEDFIYLILDLYQFSGIPVAVAEVDITQLTVDLRSVLEEYNQRNRKNEASTNDEHLFLVLDRKLQGIPWESLPAMRGRSVSRIPSIDFLLDRVEYAKYKEELSGTVSSTPVGSATVDPRKGFFILNPSGDLVGTESRFQDWTSGLKRAGWDGIIGHPPSEQQFVNALRDKDFVV